MLKITQPNTLLLLQKKRTFNYNKPWRIFKVYVDYITMGENNGYDIILKIVKLCLKAHKFRHYTYIYWTYFFQFLKLFHELYFFHDYIIHTNNFKYTPYLVAGKREFFFIVYISPDKFNKGEKKIKTH